MSPWIRAVAHASSWERPAARTGGAQVARATQYLLFGQVDNGAQCPVTITRTALPALCQAGALGTAWLAKILSRDYVPRSLPVSEKRGALIGMSMTEKQGGSDVRANTTRATQLAPAAAFARLGADGEGAWEIVGQPEVPRCAARAWQKPAMRDALKARLRLVGAGTAPCSRYIDALMLLTGQAAGDKYGACRLAERIVTAVQPGLLLRHAPVYVAEAFVCTRIEVDVGGAFGRLPPGVDCAAILARVANKNLTANCNGWDNG